MKTSLHVAAWGALAALSACLPASAASVSFVNVPFNGYVLFDSGDLTRQELGLTVNPLGAAWDSEMTRLSFEVLLNNRGDFDQSNDTWLYRYTFTVPEKAISNVLLETSQGINLLGGTTRGGREGPGTFGDSGGSAPGIPGTLFGLKFNTTGDPLSFSWQVETDRAPMWGDFYAKSGRIRIGGDDDDNGNGRSGRNRGGDDDDDGGKLEWVYAFNRNFGQPAPDFVQGVSVDGFAIVPNLTTGGPPAVPVPAAVWLLGSALGLVPVIARRRAA